MSITLTWNRRGRWTAKLPARWFPESSGGCTQLQAAATRTRLARALVLFFVDVPLMRADIGDRVWIHSSSVGMPARGGQILAVQGDEGRPPYRVRFDDGHQTLLVPGPDCLILPSPRTSADMDTGTASGHDWHPRA